MITGSSSLRRLGKYELVARIGEGGMAEVHLARQRGPRQFEKIVVVKTVRPHLASHPQIASMLLEEARIAALVKHPNVVDIYDLGEEDGTFFIAMEYLEGESLASILKVSRQGVRLDPFSTARIVADCAAGLHAAHELHDLSGEPLELVHQDVTPGNVIVLYSGQVKLVDFGVARVATSVDDGLIKGKTGYLAPELVGGAIADRRSDVWSLGVVLWEALTLRRLFSGRTEEEALAKIRAGEVPPPSSLVSSVPRELDEIVFAAMARDPARRYQTAAAMHADLAQILRHASWSSTEPIARFMRSQFVDRINARRELLRELATARQARASTLERLLALPAEAPSPAGRVVDVIGAHGTGKHVADPAAVAISDVDIDVDDVAIVIDQAPPTPTPAPPPRVGPAPTVKMPSLRRKIGVVAVIGGALIGGIAAAMTIASEPGRESASAPDGGIVMELAATAAHDRHLQAAPPAATPDAAVEAEAVEVEAGPPDEPEPVVDRQSSSKKHHHHDRHDKDGKDDKEKVKEGKDPPDPGDRTPTPGPETARSLYKQGLQRFVAGDVGGAIELFNKSKAKDSGYAPAYRGLGMAYEKRGDRSRARRAFETYLKLAPRAGDAAQIQARLERL